MSYIVHNTELYTLVYTYYLESRDNFFTLILIYLLLAICIDSLDNLKDFFGIRFFFDKVKVLEISLQKISYYI